MGSWYIADTLQSEEHIYLMTAVCVCVFLSLESGDQGVEITSP